ncbi:MAG: ROK family protein [Acidimicrobiales bacterium]
MNQRRVGIDVGGTKTLAVVVDLAHPGVILDQRVVPTPVSAPAVIDVLLDLARELGAVEQLGLGLAGLVENGAVLRSAPNLQCLIDVPVQDILVDALQFPVVIENDATCALFAEMECGAARGKSDVVLVTLGTGIGGGVATGGTAQRGAHGFAGEPGHMCVDPNGPLCVCGRRGCWERFASGAGLVRLAQRQGLSTEGGGGIGGEYLARLAREGDDAAVQVWSEFADWLALGLANLADILDPELIVIGGGLVGAADLFLGHTRGEFFGAVLGGAARIRTTIEPAQLGSSAGAIGAALLH